MAKRRHKKSHGRRRGMHGMPGAKGLIGGLVPIAGMVAGAVAAKFATNKLLASSTMNPMIKNAIPLVAGIIIAGMDKSRGMLHNIGTGMATMGGLTLAQSLIPGLEGITEADINGIEEDITVGDINEIGDITVGDSQMEGDNANMMD